MFPWNSKEFLARVELEAVCGDLCIPYGGILPCGGWGGGLICSDFYMWVIP